MTELVSNSERAHVFDRSNSAVVARRIRLSVVDPAKTPVSLRGE